MIRWFPLLLCVLLVFSGCAAASPTLIQMELTKDYDTKEPFVHEKLFYVDKSVDALELDISFQMRGERGLLEILENDTKHAVWSQSWDGDTKKTTFTVSLDGIEKDKEYVIRFTGFGIDSAKITITSQDSLVKERERPAKPEKTK